MFKPFSKNVQKIGTDTGENNKKNGNHKIDKKNTLHKKNGRIKFDKTSLTFVRYLCAKTLVYIFRFSLSQTLAE